MESLCRKIGMPEDVTGFLCTWQPETALDLSVLTREETWETGLAAIKAALGDDPRGRKIFWCMFRCAVAAKAEFDRLGLSEQIYYDTMACFSRFVGEYREKYGVWGFDLDFWTVRQVSCKLFRIGELEYELVQKDGENWISLHIPTDICLKEEGLRRSYLQARQVIAAVFPPYAEAQMYCRSWLMSPVLSQLLPPQSNIPTFQRSFSIEAVPNDGMGFLSWVTKRPLGPVEELPENTTLQRKLKEYLLQGNTYCFGMGILRPEPFTEYMQ